MRRSGFTMIEMLMAVMILSIMTVVTAITFSSVTNSWKKATVVAERMLTADYALGQVVAGLRSAYYPANGNQNDAWGLAMIDGGDGTDPGSSDMIEWTKTGTAIVGDKSLHSESTHRVRLWVEDAQSKDEPGGLWAKVWNADLMLEEDPERFDDDDYGEKFLLVEDVIGMDCEVQKDAATTESDGRPKWEEEWATSNMIPYRVKLTFRMKPPEKGDDPLPIMRVVEMPAWEMSQKPFQIDSTGSGGAGGQTTTGGKSGGATGGTKGGGSRGGGGGGRGPLGGGGAPPPPAGGGGMR